MKMDLLRHSAVSWLWRICGYSCHMLAPNFSLADCLQKCAFSTLICVRLRVCYSFMQPAHYG